MFYSKAKLAITSVTIGWKLHQISLVIHTKRTNHFCGFSLHEDDCLFLINSLQYLALSLCTVPGCLLKDRMFFLFVFLHNAVDPCHTVRLPPVEKLKCFFRSK